MDPRIRAHGQDSYSSGRITDRNTRGRRRARDPEGIRREDFIIGTESVKATNLDGNTIDLSAADLEPFKACLRGPMLREGDPAYDVSRKLWNGMVDRRPALIVQPTGMADVMECVKFAREHRLLLSVKCGGHNVAGTAMTDRGLTLDMSRMKGVFVDPKGRTVRVQAGCLMGDVDRETQVHGLATVLGFVSETGVAGLTLGGGMGYLSRRFGWTVDNLLEVEIVVADGRVLRASETEHKDLFWALRGGGGNFGIVTSFTYRLHPIGPKILGGLLLWPAERAAEVLEAFRKVATSGRRELTLAATMRCAPPAPFVPPEWHGKPIIGVVAFHTGPVDQAKEDVSPLRRLNPIVDLVVEKTYTQQQSMLDPTQPKGLHYYWKSEYLSGITDELVAMFREHGARVTSPLSQIIIFQLGGAIADRDADDGAVGNRNAEWVIVAQSAWRPEDPDGQRHLAWARGAWEAMRPFSTGGVYINFQTADEGADRVRAAYGTNFDRLAAIKAKYDPENLFRMNRNIAPAT